MTSSGLNSQRAKVPRRVGQPASGCLIDCEVEPRLRLPPTPESLTRHRCNRKMFDIRVEGGRSQPEVGTGEHCAGMLGIPGGRIRTPEAIPLAWIVPSDQIAYRT